MQKNAESSNFIVNLPIQKNNNLLIIKKNSMKKSYILVVIFCLVLGFSVSAAPQNKKVTFSKEKIEFLKKSKQRVKPIQKATSANLIEVLAEDFSKFTAGTEAAPDATDITDYETGEIPASFTQVPGWAGYGVFQAGGKAFIDVVPYSDGDDTGFIDSPVMDLSANGGVYTVNFKARSSSSLGDFLLVVWFQENEIFGYDAVELTDQWEDFSLEFEGGNSATAIEMYALEGSIYLDDISVLSGSSKLSAPVALDATNVTSTSFTANWQAVEDATDYGLYVYTKTEDNVNASDLFISEYVEGSSNNRAIEIYNGTGATVDLSSYTLKQAVNGEGWDKDVSYSLPLSGNLANNTTYVIANAQASAATVAKADLTIAYSTTAQGGRIMSFTGDDAMGLFKNNVLIDLIGNPIQKTDIATDMTIIRVETVHGPNADFDEEEWYVEDKDYIDDLGTHSFDGSSVIYEEITGSPFITTGTSYEVTGLESGVTYYYSVDAANDVTYSGLSNEIKVELIEGSGLNKTTVAELTISNGNLILPENNTSDITIFNVSGMKIAHYDATVKSISISDFSKGIYLIKIGESSFKVIF